MRCQMFSDKKINLSSFLEEVGLTGENVEIFESPGMYPHKERAEDNWSYFTAWGFRWLYKILTDEGKTVNNLSIVGIGSGVEGILAGKIFQPKLKTLVITDIDREVVSGALQNIQNTMLGHTAVTPLIGSFCEPIARANMYVDLIFGNIPNLPASGAEDLSLGAEKGTFVPSLLYNGYKPSVKFISWALGSQFAYLQSAYKVLPVGGSVVTALGGRMPISVVEELFSSCNFRLEDVLVGFKEQTEALIDFQGYHRLEQEHGVSFEFYVYRDAIELMEKNGIKNPSSEISGKELKVLLEPFKISAGESLSLHERKISVGHTVHLFRGIK